VEDQRKRTPVRARVFLGAVNLGALLAVVFTFRSWTPELPARFVVYAILALLCSRMNVVFPGVPGNFSVNYVLSMLGLLELQLPEALLITMLGMAAQTYWHFKSRSQNLRLKYLTFNVASISMALLSAAWIFRQPWFLTSPAGELLRLTFAGVVYFVVNTISLSLAIAFSEGRSIVTVWKGLSNWLFLYYLLGVSLAELVHMATLRLGWTFTLALLPLLYTVYRSFRLYFAKMEQEKAHAQNMASLHLRTIEALAMAIEAKDECTGEHLRRVQVYSLELAKHLGLDEDAIHALQAASILHDIGKLAVPDYIISKPGKLTPEEFDRMKIHTIVGADILEQVSFPYPVAPIVRSHHEKWDGSGYPDGLRGEEIPIGARILSAVDCLDALASDRQYRRALPLDEAMNYVSSMAGKHFDPTVIDLLQRHYRDFEALAQKTPLNTSRLRRDIVVNRGDAPDAGYEKNRAAVEATPERAKIRATSVAFAIQEMQAVMDLTRDLDGSLRPEEILSVLAQRLKQVVPYDCVAFYVRRGDLLKPSYVSGENSRTFASLEIPVGQGLSGWVVENGKPIVNGNPSVEPGYVKDPSKYSVLSSALSVPLRQGAEYVMGALTLYKAENDAYNTDHLRVLSAISNRIAQALENADKLKLRQPQTGTDELTGLPNAESLNAYLESELERCALQGKRLAVLACNLDGLTHIDDSLGHQASHEFLKRVATILQSNCRSSDYVAKMGRDQFAVLLADAHPGELAARIESLDRMIRAASRELCGEESAGISVGVACFPENGSDIDSLLSCADRELERAKRERKASGGVLQLARSIE
jgi:diguanylate cyclase (GGDEF)-like protein/putative nucleotidyltransferase with HDIG domain